MSSITDPRLAAARRGVSPVTVSSAWFVAVCMVVIAASLGVVLYTQLGFSVAEAGWAAFSGLVTMVLAEFYTLRMREKARFEGELQAIAGATGEVSREVAKLSARLEASESHVSRRIRETVDARLGVVLDDIASVETLMREMSGEIREIREAQARLQEQRAAPRPTAAAPRGAPPREAAAAAADITRIDADLARAIAYGLRNDEIDIHLQAVVKLPQRRTTHYEALARLRGSNGETLLPSQILPEARKAGLIARIDAAVVRKALRVADQTARRDRDTLLFCNVDAESLRGAGAKMLLETVERAPAPAHMLVLELAAQQFAALGSIEHETIEALAEMGCRFGLDNLDSLALDGGELHRQHVRFVKVDAAVLLDPEVDSGDIHPSDFARLMARSGIEAIATRIESEGQVLDLLDYDVPFAQGYFFGRPRPVRLGPGAAPQAAAG